MRSDDSGIAPAPCSSAARASTRSSACRSSSFGRTADTGAGTGAGTEDFSSAMPNYMRLDPAEYDVQLSDKGVADGVGNPESTNECGSQVGSDLPVHRSQIVAHVAIED